MNHEPECRSYAVANDYPPCICEHLKTAYARGREDAAAAVREAHYTTYDLNDCIGVAIAAARGAEPHQNDTNAHPDSQRFRYGNGNNIPTVGNTILDDSDDEKVVADNYVDNVTDAGDTPQPATNWVRSLLQPGDVDTPDTEQSEPINAVVRTVSPASTLQNRQAADADV